MAIVSEELRDLIRRSGRSLNSIAIEAGVPQPCLSRFMSGTRGLSAGSFNAIAKVMGFRMNAPPSKGLRITIESGADLTLLEAVKAIDEVMLHSEVGELWTIALYGIQMFSMIPPEDVSDEDVKAILPDLLELFHRKSRRSGATTTEQEES